MDGLKPLVIEHNALQSARANSKVKTLLDERLPLSELIGIAGKIVACYPNGGRNAGDSYIGALAQALSCYPACIIRRAHRVPGGIPSECRMLPSVADIIAWCERETEPMRIQVHVDERRAQQLADREEFNQEQTVERSGRLTMDDLKARYGDWHDGWREPGSRAREQAEEARK